MAFGKIRVAATILAMLMLAHGGWAGQTAIAIKIQVTPELAAFFQQRGFTVQVHATSSSAPTLMVRFHEGKPSVQRFNAQGQELPPQGSTTVYAEGKVYTVMSL